MKLPTISFQSRNGQVSSGTEIWRGLCPISGKPVVTVTTLPGPLGLPVYVTIYQDVPEQYVIVEP